MSVKLCQIIAVEKSVKNKCHESVTASYQKMQKPALLTGISRTYRPNDEAGEQLPSESTKIQLNTNDVLNEMAKVMTDLFDVTATKDVSNCHAVADVVVGETVIAKALPVTYLIFLEKKLVDIHTFISKLPTLDPSEDWTFDPNVGSFASKPSETTRTKKVFVPLVLSPATDKHPANVKEGFEDKGVGTWKTVKFSGAMPAQKVADMLDRVERLQKAVKFARSEANSRDVEHVKVGEKLFNFLLG
jgi:hypothetical protein